MVMLDESVPLVGAAVGLCFSHRVEGYLSMRRLFSSKLRKLSGFFQKRR